MRIRIVSDGTCTGTKVVDDLTGATIKGITSVVWAAISDTGECVCHLSFEDGRKRMYDNVAIECKVKVK